LKYVHCTGIHRVNNCPLNSHLEADLQGPVLALPGPCGQELISEDVVLLKCPLLKIGLSSHFPSYGIQNKWHMIDELPNTYNSIFPKFALAPSRTSMIDLPRDKCVVQSYFYVDASGEFINCLFPLLHQWIYTYPCFIEEAPLNMKYVGSDIKGLLTLRLCLTSNTLI
jgi:hypothetical protein